MRTKLPELRRQRKLSQEELARAVGVTRQTITSIESGKYVASLPLAYKIAHYFGYAIEAVFCLDEEYGGYGKQADHITQAAKPGTEEAAKEDLAVS